MSRLSRREFVYMMAVLGAAPVFANSHTRMTNTNKLEDYYKLKPFGNTRLLHLTDCHAQLVPVYFREPSVNLGFFDNLGKPPHIVGEKFLDYYGIKDNPRLEYAYTCVNFEKHAKAMGRTGGFAQIKTVVDFLKNSFGADKTLLLDGGDTWQGSWTALQTRGKDMVGAMNLLGVDIAVGHWEFTYTAKEVLENVKLLNAEFLAQNVKVKEDALFNGTAEAYDEDKGYAFKPYTIKVINGSRVAIIGQAFPYTTIANPQRFIPDWTFSINKDGMQELVNEIRESEKPDAVIVLSHNGYDTDRKMAQVCTGIDFIMGGHTHDGVPEAVPIKNKEGTTYVCNAGSNGKFLNVLDLDIQNGKIKDFKFTLLPIFSDLIPEDKEMKKYIEDVRAPFKKELTREIATTDETLFRRGNFNGSWDQIICDALVDVKDAEIALSPGFRWGTSVMPGQAITFDDLATQTAMTYPETYRRGITGKDIKAILEDVADNLFNPDPFYQQGGDMVRTGGISYKINPTANMGERISDITLTRNGQKLQASKEYQVAGWSTVGSKSPGEPVWETVETYLKSVKHVKNLKIDTPDIIGIKGNPGIIS
jgi:sulfur-oxidizing protein SoxB|tara:strand:- start:249 stop:2018 length:1770 start_codon:yes stop_codon:yes gene_type:complete